MLRGAVLFVLFVLLVSTSAGVRTTAAASLAAPDTGIACEYYRLRSAPAPQDGSVSFVAFLAEACVAARRSIETGLDAEQTAARKLLATIAELHWTVVQMNSARDEAVAGLTGVTRMLRLTRVTPTGEFLIAHRMGLLRDFDAWLDTGADFSLAWYR
ncbi:MAG TPA: hypothetical protein VLA52_03235 [Thermohalobaculum sp.]|nr:hypothetical protein [Thermohalobaculum sp.]